MACCHKSLLSAVIGFLLFTMSFMVLAKSGEDHEKIATLGHPFVGMLLKGSPDESFWPHCTITLTRPDAVLTARHCIKNLHGYNLKVFFPFEGIREIATDRISVFCEQFNDDCSKRIDDLAVIELSTPYTILSTATLGGASDLDMVTEKTVVGFGLDDGSLSDNGIKREGQVMLNDCERCAQLSTPGDNTSIDYRSLCFDFTTDKSDDNALNLIGSQRGDSGGPMLDVGCQSSSIIGLARGTSWACSNRDHREIKFVDLTNIHYQAWITGAFCDPPCETKPGNAVVLLKIESAKLDRDDIQDDYQINIPPGAKKLIVTMNHEVGGWDPEPSDLDILLSIKAECMRYTGVEVCTVDKPVAGSHTVSVKRIHKQAAYQLAAVALYENPSVIIVGHSASGNE